MCEPTRGAGALRSLRMHGALLLLVGWLSACGRVGFELRADGLEPDASCWAAWLDRTVVLELPRTLDELGPGLFGDPSLSENGLRLYVWRSGTSFSVYTATRASVDESWTTAVLVASLSSSSTDFRVSTNGDSTVAVLNSDRTGNLDLWLTSRASTSELFAVPDQSLLANVVLPGTSELDPELSADGLTLYFSRNPGSGRQLFISTRTSLAAPFGAPTTIAELPGVNHDPSVSPDQRVILFAASGTTLMYATRDRVTDPFGSPQPVPIPDATQTESDVEISPNGCEVYFRRMLAGSEPIYTARVVAP